MTDHRTNGPGPGPAHGRTRDPLLRRVILPDFLVVFLAPIAENVSYKIAIQGRQTWLFEDLGYLLGAGLLIVITFFGVWTHQRDDRKLPEAEAIRDAVTATVVLLYLVLISWAVFFTPGPNRILLSDQLLASLTTVTAVVVAFYFISGAAGGKWALYLLRREEGAGPSPAQPGAAPQGPAQPGAAPHGAAPHGAVAHGTAPQGLAQQKPTRQNPAPQHLPPQHLPQRNPAPQDDAERL
jgi:hypothetical protein